MSLSDSDTLGLVGNVVGLENWEPISGAPTDGRWVEVRCKSGYRFYTQWPPLTFLGDDAPTHFRRTDEDVLE
jgi:hypothetical protein